MDGNNDKLDDEIKNIIATLCEEQQISKDKAKEIIEKLKSIYQQDYRHKYSQITKIILEKSDSKEERLVILAQNLKTLEESIKNPNPDDEELNKVKHKLDKLLDHINLEVLRLGDSGKNFDKLNKSSDELQNKFKELQHISKAIEKQLDKQQTQYITILGIFASIVLTFVGGFTFSTSALSNIHDASIYRLIFILSFIALFFGNILFALFNFLSKLNTRINDENKRWFQEPVLLFNGAMIIIMGLDCLFYFLCIKKILFLTPYHALLRF